MKPIDEIVMTQVYKNSVVLAAGSYFSNFPKDGAALYGDTIQQKIIIYHLLYSNNLKDFNLEELAIEDIPEFIANHELNDHVKTTLQSVYDSFNNIAKEIGYDSSYTYTYEDKCKAYGVSETYELTDKFTERFIYDKNIIINRLKSINEQVKTL